MLAARVAVGDQVASQADDDLVHVDAQRRAGRSFGERRLFGGDLGQAQARAAVFSGDERGEVSGVAQVLQVGFGVGVVRVRVGGALVDAGEQVGVQEAHRGPLSWSVHGRGRGRLTLEPHAGWAL